MSQIQSSYSTHIFCIRQGTTTTLISIYLFSTIFLTVTSKKWDPLCSRTGHALGADIIVFVVDHGTPFLDNLVPLHFDTLQFFLSQGYLYFKEVPLSPSPNYMALHVAAPKYVKLSMEGLLTCFDQLFKRSFNTFYKHRVHVGLRSMCIGLSRLSIDQMSTGFVGLAMCPKEAPPHSPRS